MKLALTLSSAAICVAIGLVPSRGEACGDGYRNEIELMGWTRDSRFVVYKETLRCWGDDEGSAPKGTDGGQHSIGLGFVVDARSGRVDKHLLKIEGMPPKEEAKQMRALPKAQAFEAWLKAHPLARSRASLQSPNGSARCMLIAASGRDLLEDPNGIDYPIESDESEAWLARERPLRQAISARGKLWTSSKEFVPGQCDGVLNGELSAHWSPDSLRVAWISRSSGCMGLHEEALFIQPAGPRLQILADRDVTQRELESTCAALEKAWLVPAVTGRAPGRQARSIVYYAKGSEEAADAVAKAVPGGAATAPLTWKTEFDLVLDLAVPPRGR